MAKKPTFPAIDTAAAPAVVTRDASIGTLINKAGRAANTMLACIREAAEKAKIQLNPAVPLAERIEAVMLAYSADFKAVDANVKALFKDALTLHACAQDPVTVKVHGKDEPMTAGQAINTNKHALRDAAKQVREAHGLGRKAGGGRKPGGAKSAASKAAGAVGDAPDVVTKSEIDVFTDWLDALPDYLQDAVYHERIVAKLIELGYALGKAAKGRIVKGAASA